MRAFHAGDGDDDFSLGSSHADALAAFGVTFNADKRPRPRRPPQPAVAFCQSARRQRIPFVYHQKWRQSP